MLVKQKYNIYTNNTDTTFIGLGRTEVTLISLLPKDKKFTQKQGLCKILMITDKQAWSCSGSSGCMKAEGPECAGNYQYKWCFTKHLDNVCAKKPTGKLLPQQAEGHSDVHSDS